MNVQEESGGYESYDDESVDEGLADLPLLADNFSIWGHHDSHQIGPGGTSSGNKLGMFRGVFVPCSLKLFAILFLRLSWSVGHSGLFGALGLIYLAGAAALLTSLSLCAVSTNGRVRGGGAYYMISRALGPDFGGVIGIVFWAGMVLATAFFLVGLAEELAHIFHIELISGSSESEMGTHAGSSAENTWNIFLLATISLFVCTTISIAGSALYAVSGLAILAVGGVSVFMAFISLLFNSSGATRGFTGWNSTTFSDNLYASTSDEDTVDKVSLFLVFAVVFPGFTGLLSGANLSGDLANPGKAIPQGTLASVGMQMVIYTVFAFLFAGTVEGYALRDNTMVSADACFAPWLVQIATCLSSFGAALTAMIGSAKILQALSKDGVITFLRPFAKGSRGKNEPRRGILLCFLLAQCILFIGDLNAIAPFISMMFLLSFCLMNLACFALRVASTPNFRPLFRYFTWHTGLAGALLSVVIMFLIDVTAASMTIFLALSIYIYISLQGPVMPWGDVSQALIFHQVRKYLLRMDYRREHVKTWRPKLMFVIDHAAINSSAKETFHVIDFLNNMKKGGLFLLGEVMTGDFLHVLPARFTRGHSWNDFVRTAKVKAFVNVSVGASFRAGVQQMLLMVGLGSMKPNTLVFLFPEKPVPGAPPRSALDKSKEMKNGDLGAFSYCQAASVLWDGAQRARNAAADRDKTVEFVNTLRDVIRCGKNVILARHFDKLPPRLVTYGSKEKSIPEYLHMVEEASGPFKRRQKGSFHVDLWSFFTTNWEATLTLSMQLIYLLNLTPTWRRARLRICSVVETEDREDQELETLRKFVLLMRMQADIKVLSVVSREDEDQATPYNRLPLLERCRVLNTLVQETSKRSAVVVVPIMPPPIEEEKYRDYVDQMAALSKDLPPTLHVCASNERDIDSGNVFPSVVATEF